MVLSTWQDPIANKVVAVGERAYGLYKFTSASYVGAAISSSQNKVAHGLVTSSDQFANVHARLGHCSVSKMLHIPSLSCTATDGFV